MFSINKHAVTMDFLTHKKNIIQTKVFFKHLFLESKQCKSMKKKKREEQTEDSQKLQDSMRRKIPGIPAPG